MYCNQCEQTLKGIACTRIGVCGKREDVAEAQNVLIHALRLFAGTLLKADAKNVGHAEHDMFFLQALFSTLTNVNFDEKDLRAKVRETVRRRREMSRTLGCTCSLDDAEIDKSAAEAEKAATAPDAFAEDADVRSAMQILLFGLKGVAAYAYHAARLGQTDSAMMHRIYELVCAGFDGRERSLNDWAECLLECGRVNVRAMELLDAGNTGTYGDPVPTPVSLGVRKGKCILVTGHDLKDLHELLEQTKDSGINIYTHGEMLPAHAYPVLHAYPHFAGHFGTAWQNQQREMPAFPGPVLFTTNCIQDPKGYADRVFTTGMVAWPGCTHCADGDFSALIAKAMEMPGFAEDSEGKTVLTGFGRKTLADAAPALLDAVKAGAVKHIFLVGGCDGARTQRSYYAEFVEQAPKDTLILTLACGKFRFFDKDLGKIGDFPRLLDIGQCNDAYAAVKTALALAEACGCGVNDLPLSLVLSWYEQKAVAILLSLLALGVKGIRLGPTLPAFISPAILNLLVENWGIAPVTTPQEDIAALMKGK